MAVEPKVLDLTIYQGRTFQYVLRWETAPVVYKAITGITRAAPVTLTVPSHGLSTGWYVAVTDVGGMTEINVTSNSPRASDYKQVTVIDSNTISINSISSAGFGAYTSGGYIRYNTPKSLDSAVARMHIRNRVGGVLLQSLSSVSGEIVLDDVNHTVTLNLTDDITKAITYTKGVYDLEIEDSTGNTYPVLAGSVTVVPEITVEV